MHLHLQFSKEATAEEKQNKDKRCIAEVQSATREITKDESHHHQQTSPTSYLHVLNQPSH